MNITIVYIYGWLNSVGEQFLHGGSFYRYISFETNVTMIPDIIMPKIHNDVIIRYTPAFWQQFFFTSEDWDMWSD